MSPINIDTGNKYILLFLKTVPVLILTLVFWAVSYFVVIAKGNDPDAAANNEDSLPSYYIVQTGDTVYDISNKYGLPRAEIINLNNLENAALIIPGQKLLLRDDGQDKQDYHQTSSTVLNSSRTNEEVAAMETAAADTPFVLDVHDADLRDVLSVLAINLKKTIVLMDEPVKVTFKMEGDSPLQAMQLLLKSEGYDYVEENGLIMVARPGRMHGDFYDHLLLTRFNLQYISASAFSGMFDQLGLPLSIIELETNPRAFWAKGTPRELGHVREVISALDRPENADLEITGSLQRFNLHYLSTEIVKPLPGEMGIEVDLIVLPTMPQVFWAQGNPEDMRRLKELLVALDRPENAEINMEMTSFPLYYVPPATMKSILEKAGFISNNIIIDILDEDERARQMRAPYIWVFGTTEQLEMAQELIDIADRGTPPSIFYYSLNNISAADASERLAEMDRFAFNQTMTFSYAQFSHELLVICPPNLELDVRAAISKLDEPRQRIRIPVDSADGENAHRQLVARRELLAQLTGISISRMFISSNLSGDSSSPYYILWVEETPDKIQKVRDMVDFIDSP